MRPQDTQMCVVDDRPEAEAMDFWRAIDRLRYVEAIRLAADIVEVAEDRGWVMKNDHGEPVDNDDVASLLCDMAETKIVSDQ